VHTMFCGQLSDALSANLHGDPPAWDRVNKEIVRGGVGRNGQWYCKVSGDHALSSAHGPQTTLTRKLQILFERCSPGWLCLPGMVTCSRQANCHMPGTMRHGTACWSVIRLSY